MQSKFKLNPLDVDVEGPISIDTETYGLMYQDRVFSVQIADLYSEGHYFNLKAYPDAMWLPVLNESDLVPRLQPLLDKYRTTGEEIFMANALYDIQKLEVMGLNLEGLNIVCTHSQQRLIDNLNSVSLSSQGKYFGYEKFDNAKEYISKHRLKEDIVFRNIKIGEKPLYSQLPWSEIAPYAMNDAEITLKIGLQQKKLLQNNFLSKQERDLTWPVYAMKKRGLRLDLIYTEACFEYHQKKSNEYSRKLGDDFVDGKKFLTKLFNKHALPILYKNTINKKTGKKSVEPRFGDDYLQPHKAIEDIQNIIGYRKHSKLYRSFYLKLLYYSDGSIIHPDLNPHGTITGRFSSENPNFQNLPNKNKEVKRAIIPEDDHYFLELDYQALELRLTYDQAGETRMINVINSGQDQHQVMADRIKRDRDTAKTAIFSILYGTGPMGLALQLGISPVSALNLIKSIRQAIPNVMAYQNRHKERIKAFGHTKNALGRVLHFKRGDEYKTLNTLIQSLGGDVVKRAIIDIHNFLKPYKSHMVLTVHDSILIQMHISERHLVPEIIKIMEAAYTPKNGLGLKVSAKESLISYGDMQDVVLYA